MRSKLVTPVWLLATLIALLGIMIGLGHYEPDVRSGIGNPKNLAAAGFIVLAAFSMGEFFRFLGIPALLGYITAGILFGPNLAPMLPHSPEALFGLSVIEDLALISVLTVGVIGTMGGGELKIAELKDNFKTIAAVVGLNVIFNVPLRFVLVMLVGFYAPTLIPFVPPGSHADLIAVALLIGVFGAAMSPTVTLAVMQDARARGRMTSIVLGIVVFADLVLVGIFLVSLTLSKLLISEAGFTLGALLQALPGIGIEFGLAFLLGIGAGIAVIAYLRWVARETLLFTVALVFVVSYLCQILHAETLLAFLTAGFVVQNFSRLGHDMIHSLEKISLPVFVIYFMTQAARLDLSAVVGYLPIAALVSVARAGSLYAACRFGTKLTGAPEVARRHLWLAFFSLGSVDLVLAGLVVDVIPTWGGGLQMVVMAIVIIHILGGPPLLKLALDRAGETEGSRAENRAEAHEVDRALQIRSPSETAEIRLPVPRVEDPRFAARLEQLRTRALEQHQSVFVTPIVERGTKMKAALADVRTASEAASVRLAALVEAASQAPERIRAELQQAELAYHRDLETAFRRLDEVAGSSVKMESVDRFFAELRALEPFGTSFGVAIEPARLRAEPGDGAAVRVLKLLRRARYATTGSWTRAVPLGRLFKYYVELSVPLYVARATESSASLAEKLWTELGHHFRRNEELYHRLQESLVRPQSEKSASSKPADNTRRSVPPAASVVPAPAGSAPPTREEIEEWQATARGLLASAVSEEQERMSALESGLARWQGTSLERYTLAVSEPFTQLMDAAERAGTMELPSFRYAPSSRFDRSRQAQAELRDRLQREQNLASGHWGWALLGQRLFLFSHWYRGYQRRIADSISANLRTPCESELELFRLECAVSAEEDTVDWRHRLDHNIRPSWRRTERTFHRVLTSFGQGNLGRQLLGLLEARITELPSQVTLLSVDPETALPDHSAVFVAPLREWLFSSLVREIALRFFELHDRAQRVLGEGLESLQDVEQVVEYSLLSAVRHGEAPEGPEETPRAVAEGGLKRAARLLEELSEKQTTALQQIERWILSETDTVLARTLEPVLRRRVEDVRRAINRSEQASLVRRGGSWLSLRRRQVIDLFAQLWRTYVPPLTALAFEVRARMADPPRMLAPDELRRRLGATPSPLENVPASYRRLFAPLPLEVPEFYVPRREPEEQLLTAIREWNAGRPMSVLVTGDRGVGRRSLVHHVLADVEREGRGLGDVPHKSIILEPEQVREPEIASRMSTVLTGRGARGFEDLLRQIQGSGTRSLVIVENGEKLFARTELGFETFRSFMRLVTESREQVLWIVIMRAAGMRWLQSALGIRELFAEVVDVPPFDGPRLVQMIQQRHRVSGYSVMFDRPERSWPGLLGRAFDAGPVLREPTGEFFEDLSELSGGNALLALELWLSSIRSDEKDDQLLHVAPLAVRPTSLVEGLGEPKPLLLSLLAQHGSLSLFELEAIFSGLGVKEVASHLSHLARVGFVEVASGETAFRLRPRAEAMTVHELRERGWL